VRVKGFSEGIVVSGSASTPAPEPLAPSSKSSMSPLIMAASAVRDIKTAPFKVTEIGSVEMLDAMSSTSESVTVSEINSTVKIIEPHVALARLTSGWLAKTFIRCSTNASASASNAALSEGLAMRLQSAANVITTPTCISVGNSVCIDVELEVVVVFSPHVPHVGAAVSRAVVVAGQVVLNLVGGGAGGRVFTGGIVGASLNKWHEHSLTTYRLHCAWLYARHGNGQL